MTSNSSLRKEREKAAREVLILDHAQRLLLRDGIQNLNLDELAVAIEYSKGTIYQHFESKEDLILAIATRVLGYRADLFDRALLFEGRSRERIRAIGVACCQFMVGHPDYFHLELTLKSASFWEKASRKQQQEHSMAAGRTFRAINRVVSEAMECRDLPRDRMPAEHVSFALAAVTMGTHIMAQHQDLRLLAGLSDPIRVVRQNQDAFLDGLGWKPLLKEWDYAATDRRIKAEIFKEATWIQ